MDPGNAPLSRNDNFNDEEEEKNEEKNEEEEGYLLIWRCNVLWNCPQMIVTGPRTNDKSSVVR